MPAYLSTQTKIRKPALLPLDLPCQDGITWFFSLNAGNDIQIEIPEADDLYKVLRFYFEGEIVFYYHDQVNIVQAIQFKYLPDVSFRLHPVDFHFKFFRKEPVNLINNGLVLFHSRVGLSVRVSIFSQSARNLYLQSRMNLTKIHLYFFLWKFLRYPVWKNLHPDL